MSAGALAGAARAALHKRALTSGAAAAAPTATRAVELAVALDSAATSACDGRTRAANGGISREAGHGTRCGAHTLTIMSAVDGAASRSAERAAAAAATSTCACAMMARISARRVSLACECVCVKVCHTARRWLWRAHTCSSVCCGGGECERRGEGGASAPSGCDGRGASVATRRPERRRASRSERIIIATLNPKAYVALAAGCSATYPQVCRHEQLLVPSSPSKQVPEPLQQPLHT